MPEIAEVAKYSSQLNTEYGGHNLINIEVVGGRFTNQSNDFQPDLKTIFASLDYPISNVSMHSKGKFIYWSMYDENAKHIMHFFITLGMSGSFGKRQKHSALKFTFDNGEVFFNDPRHFGTFKVVLNGDDLKHKLNSLGWDPLQDPIIPVDIVDKFRKYNHKRICEFLMEQGPVVCGVGNYLRAEILYKSKLHPWTLIQSLSDDEITTICQNTIDIVQEAYRAGGATIATYSDLYGIAGDFYKQFKVYGQKTDPNGYVVLKEKDRNGRTMHYVPEVQL